MRFCLQDWDDQHLDIDCAAVVLVGGVVSLLPALDADEVVVARLGRGGFRLTDEFSQRYGGLDLHVDFLVTSEAHDPLEIHVADDEGLASATELGLMVTDGGLIEIQDLDSKRAVCRFAPEQGWRLVGGEGEIGGVVEIAPASYFWAEIEPQAPGRRQRLSPLAS